MGGRRRFGKDCIFVVEYPQQAPMAENVIEWKFGASVAHIIHVCAVASSVICP